jgi:hypothetical protein
MRIIFREIGYLSMALETKYFHDVGAFEVHLFKVSALKLSHPSVCPVFKDFSCFSLLRHSLLGGGKPLLFSPFKGEVRKGMGVAL